ncbi:MAG: riboflavin synthase [Armatimonadota bacterium]|nr:riboflavin synthase [Armatimonadota bacterium]MCX7778247.1 riboflavin synthase [Armatimonadota bacterium]MDW8025485.1 riboflavin synthase [Armatimonadota bacterium]
MFTGIIEEVGQVAAVERIGGGARLTIAASVVMDDLKVGDSICVNGACLTVIRRSASQFQVDVMEETMLRTNLGFLRVGDKVNLERALKVADRLGGHFVQGHVDDTGVIASIQRMHRSWLMKINCNDRLTQFMVPKGSVAVDGVSLTTVDCGKGWFTVALIPHTLSATTLGMKRVGDVINIEVDLLAKYLHKLLQSYLAMQTNGSNERLIELLSDISFQGLS